MTDAKDGGPAFPHINPNYDGNWDSHPQRGGMSLRDWFAGRFAASAIVNAEGLGDASAAEKAQAFAQLASIAYELADAMLAARGGAMDLSDHPDYARLPPNGRRRIEWQIRHVDQLRRSAADADLFYEMAFAGLSSAYDDGMLEASDFVAKMAERVTSEAQRGVLKVAANALAEVHRRNAARR